MAARGGDGGRLQAARAAADDQHAAGASPPDGAATVLELAPGLGVLDARDRVAGVEVADAGLVAADAGADVVELAGPRRRSGSCGSQISARVMTQASAAPAARICSASCGWLIRPATMTGHSTASRTRRPRRRDVAVGDRIGGTMWSEPASDAEVPVVTFR